MDGSLAETLVALAAILVGARIFGAIAVGLGQPRVGGEMVAGLVIGELLLTPWRVVGSHHHAAVLGAAAVRFVDLLGQVGMILYLLLVGLSLSPLDLRRNGRRIAAASVPVALAAAALAPVAAEWFAGSRWQLVGGLGGAIAMAAALMINGVPFVARILQERDLLEGEFGATVLGASAILTALALLLLTLAEHRFHSTGVLAAAYPLEPLALVAVGVGAAFAWTTLAARNPLALGAGTAAALTVTAALLAAWMSLKLIGTALLGPFLVGIAVSESAATRHAIERGLGWGVPVLLVPVFLAGAGARVDPRVLDPGVLAGAGIFTALLVAVAISAGSVSSRLSGLSASDASAITAFLNCRGMMLLAVGVELSDHRLIGPRLVAVFFTGAVATTLMTGPLFARAQRLARASARRNRAPAPSWSLHRGTEVAGDATPPPAG